VGLKRIFARIILPLRLKDPKDNNFLKEAKDRAQQVRESPPAQGGPMDALLQFHGERYRESLARKAAIDSRAQTVVGFIAVMATIAFGGLGVSFALFANGVGPSVASIALLIGTVVVVGSFYVAIMCAFQALDLKQYSHPSLNSLLDEGRPGKTKIDREHLCSLITAAAHNEAQNNTKGTCLNWTYAWMRAALLLMLASILIAIILVIVIQDDKALMNCIVSSLHRSKLVL